MPYPTYVPRSKRSAKKDRISADGTDYSNAFHEFGQPSSKTAEDAGGFNPTGVTETVPGALEQSFTGQMYDIPDVIEVFRNWLVNDTVIEVQWQPNGLSDPTENLYYGNVTVSEIQPVSTFGSVTLFSVTFLPADSDGIQYAAGT